MQNTTETTRPDIKVLILELIRLHDAQGLWMLGFPPDPENECAKRPLSNNGRETVVALVETCLAHDVAPFCSVNGSSGTCDTEIVSLSEAEYDDLAQKAIKLMPSQKL